MEEITEQNGMKSRGTPEKTSPMSNGSSISNGISNGAGNGFAMTDLTKRTSDVSDKNGKLLPKQDNLVVTTIRLKPQIGLFQAVCIIVGIIIGSGIFVSPVGILLNVKSVGMSIVMWTVCGSFSTLCALCFAELGACIPESGGEYTYIRRAFGDFPGFIAMWINFVVICPVCIAASCLIFATYILRPLYGDCEPPSTSIRLLAALIICLLIIVNCVNVKWATKVQIVITASKLIALFMIIIIGFVYIGKGHVENFYNSFEGSDYSAGAIAISFYSGFWAFGGWSYLNFLTDELLEPHKNLPRAIIISMSIVTTVYIVANIAYFSVLSPIEVIKSSAVAVTFTEHTVGKITWLIPILIAISVMGSMNGTSLSMSRLFFVGAKNNHLPSIISMINCRFLTPAPSLLIILVLTIIMQGFENIFYLIEMMGFSFCTVLTCVFAGQVYLRYKEPDLKRPIKLPILLPIFLFLISIVLLAMTIVQRPNESLTTLLIMALGIPFYIIGVGWKSKPKSFERLNYKVTVLIQKILMVVPQDKDTAW
ncbi:large neutral amino acids transporter small subunit 1-like isoform X2 [Mytilus trossulus]